MYKLIFVKAVDGKWYIQLDYDGPLSDLEMVEGTDKILDMILENTRLTEDQSSIVIHCNLDQIQPGHNMVLHFDKDGEHSGSWYRVYHNIPTILSIPFSFNVWICDVIKEVFGYVPPVIYCKV